MKPAQHDPEKVNAAVKVITKGAIVGGATGAFCGILFHVVGSRFWSRYQGFTRQFKTYIQLSFIMAFGSFRIDRDLLQFQQQLRIEAMLEQQRKLEESYWQSQISGSR